MARKLTLRRSVRSNCLLQRVQVLDGHIQSERLLYWLERLANWLDSSLQVLVPVNALAIRVDWLLTNHIRILFTWHGHRFLHNEPSLTPRSNRKRCSNWSRLLRQHQNLNYESNIRRVQPQRLHRHFCKHHRLYSTTHSSATHYLPVKNRLPLSMSLLQP